jgi:hypothetical protein
MEAADIGASVIFVIFVLLLTASFLVPSSRPGLQTTIWIGIIAILLGLILAISLPGTGGPEYVMSRVRSIATKASSVTGNIDRSKLKRASATTFATTATPSSTKPQEPTMIHFEEPPADVVQETLPDPPVAAPAPPPAAFEYDPQMYDIKKMETMVQQRLQDLHHNRLDQTASLMDKRLALVRQQTRLSEDKHFLRRRQKIEDLNKNEEPK